MELNLQRQGQQLQDQVVKKPKESEADRLSSEDIDRCYLTLRVYQFTPLERKALFALDHTQTTFLYNEPPTDLTY